jgi:hypothetical protein
MHLEKALQGAEVFRQPVSLREGYHWSDLLQQVPSNVQYVQKSVFVFPSDRLEVHFVPSSAQLFTDKNYNKNGQKTDAKSWVEEYLI